MFRTQRLLLVLAAAAALAACGDTTLSLTADRTEISAGGIEYATLTAKVVRNGDPGANVPVTFTTSADPAKALTIIVKGYHEFDAENTFEGDVVDAAVSFKF